MRRGEEEGMRGGGDEKGRRGGMRRGEGEKERRHEKGL